MVSGREHGVVLHEHVALFGGDHEDLPAAAGVGILVLDAGEVGFGRHVLAQRVRGGEVGIVLGRVWDGGSTQFVGCVRHEIPRSLKS
ncbi:Uncharacterised protein [Mycobacteroides abscessus subsp. abscessus]|nr:Uncharacterised protein [Mycobacteroides abscessus subsp. abscessus]